MERAALSNKQEYQDKLAKARAKTKDLPVAVDNTMDEQQLRQLLKQLQKEKEQAQTHLKDTEEQFHCVLQQLKQQVKLAEEGSMELKQEKEFHKRRQSNTQNALEELKQAHHKLFDDYEGLQQTYRQLQQAHQKLKQSYNKLQLTHQELQQEYQKLHTRTVVSRQLSQEQVSQILIHIQRSVN